MVWYLVERTLSRQLRAHKRMLSLIICSVARWFVPLSFLLGWKMGTILPSRDRSLSYPGHYDATCNLNCSSEADHFLLKHVAFQCSKSCLRASLCAATRLGFAPMYSQSSLQSHRLRLVWGWLFGTLVESTS